MFRKCYIDCKLQILTAKKSVFIVVFIMEICPKVKMFLEIFWLFYNDN